MYYSNPKLNDNLFFKADFEESKMEYYWLAPELINLPGENGQVDPFFDACHNPDNWVFNSEEWEYHISSAAKNPPTQEEFDGTDWIGVANQIIVEFINARLGDGLTFTGDLWLRYMNMSGKDLPYHQALRIFEVAVFEAEFFDGLFDYLAGVIKALYRVSK